MNLSLKEISQQVGVSPATVSMVLHSKPGVNKDTRGRVSSALEENGYHIDAGVKEPNKKNIRFLKYCEHSLMVDGNSNFVSTIIDAVEKECRKLGYNLIMTAFGPQNLDEVFDLICSDPCDGAILLGTEWTEQHNDYLHRMKIPFVMVDNMTINEPYGCILVNNMQATYTAINHLVELGHHRIGFLANAIPTSNCKAIRAAYQESLIRLGVFYDPTLVYELYPTLQGAHRDTKALLDKGVCFPSAILANNDNLALGAIKAFKEYGLRVPEDISIVGIDDISFSAISDPPLTTMHAACNELGVWAVRLLYDKIIAPASPPMKIQVDATLILRESTCRYESRTLD